MLVQEIPEIWGTAKDTIMRIFEPIEPIDNIILTAIEVHRNARNYCTKEKDSRSRQ